MTMRKEILALTECVCARRPVAEGALVGAAAIERIADAMLEGPRLEAALARVGADPEAFAGEMVARLGALVARTLGDLDLAVGAGAAGRADRTLRQAAREGVAADEAAAPRMTAAQVDKLVAAMVAAPAAERVLKAAAGDQAGALAAALPAALTPAVAAAAGQAGFKVSGYGDGAVAAGLRALMPSTARRADGADGEGALPA